MEGSRIATSEPARQDGPPRGIVKGAEREKGPQAWGPRGAGGRAGWAGATKDDEGPLGGSLKEQKGRRARRPGGPAERGARRLGRSAINNESQTVRQADLREVQDHPARRESARDLHKQ